MKRFAQFVGAAALVAGFAAPALADMDGGAITCGQFKAMDAGGMIEATNAIQGYTAEAKNAAMVGTATQFSTATTEDMQKAIDARCGAEPDTTLVITALQKS